MERLWSRSCYGNRTGSNDGIYCDSCLSEVSFLHFFMNGFGTQTVAAITTTYRVDSIVMVPIINLGSGISTLVAQDYGSGNKKRMQKTCMVGLVLMSIVSLMLTALVLALGGHLIAIFGAGAETIQIGAGFFRRIGSFYLVYGIATVMRSYLEGIGDVSCRRENEIFGQSPGKPFEYV